MTSAGTSMMSSADPLAFAAAPHKRYRKPKSSHKASSTQSPIHPKNDSKPSAAEKNSSSSSSEAYCDEGSEDERHAQ